MFHVEGVSKMEEGAATQPFLASFIILLHPLLPHWNDNFDIPSIGVHVHKRMETGLMLYNIILEHNCERVKKITTANCGCSVTDKP